MDTFDIRKYITEGKVQNRIDSLLAYYEAETGEEADEDTKYEIEYMVSRGSDDDQIKSSILSEEKDVIEPDQDAVDAEKAAAEKEEENYDDSEESSIERTAQEEEYLKDYLDMLDNAVARQLNKTKDSLGKGVVDKKRFLDTVRMVKNSDYIKNIDIYFNDGPFDGERFSDLEIRRDAYLEYLSSILGSYFDKLFIEAPESVEESDVPTMYAELVSILGLPYNKVRIAEKGKVMQKFLKKHKSGVYDDFKYDSNKTMIVRK